MRIISQGRPGTGSPCNGSQLDELLIDGGRFNSLHGRENKPYEDKFKGNDILKQDEIMMSCGGMAGGTDKELINQGRTNSSENTQCFNIIEKAKEIVWVCNARTHTQQKYEPHNTLVSISEKYKDQFEIDFENKKLYRFITSYTGFPKNVLEFSNIDKDALYKKGEKHHPTQKPVELLKFLINVYTNENDTVLDFTMGSGSTGVACKKTNRNFVGIELLKCWFDVALERIQNE